MIARLRRKFVATCMLLVTAVLVIVFTSFFFATRSSLQQSSMEMLERVISEPYHPVLQDWRDSREVELPYFTVDVIGQTAYLRSGTYYQLDEETELKAILAACMEQNAETGILSEYSLRYLSRTTPFGEQFAFVDISMELTTLHNLLLLLVRILILALLLVFGISVLLARRAVRPTELAMAQQKQFLSDASHELKTPLTVILSNADLLLQSSTNETALTLRRAEHIRTEAEHMKQLVEQMLTLARIENAAAAPLSTVDWSETVSNAVLLFEPVAFEAGKTLEDTWTPQLLVLGDKDKLHQLCTILLDNAVKYSSVGSVIRVTLQEQEKKAVLTVSNEGAPIPQEALPHLFERFYRVDSARSSEGFGLGLPIAQQIVTLHHGTIHAESDCSSTRFIVTLPLQKS